VTIAELGMSNKVYRCLSRQEHEDDSVTLTLREETSATYTDPLVADYGALSPATPDPTPDDALAPPTALTGAATTDAIVLFIAPDPANGPGVEYEIFEHSSATPFASSDLVWTGAATTVTLPRNNYTLSYFWVRARRGAALSSQYPTGDGVEVGADRPYRQLLVHDPEFEVGSVNYWAYFNATYTATGGLFAGYVRLSPDGVTDASVGSVYRNNARIYGTFTVKVSFRYRVSTALTGSNKRLSVKTICYYKIISPVVTDAEYVDLTSAAVGTWYDANLVMDYVGTEGAGGKVPYFTVKLSLANADVSDGDVDIDYLNAEIIG